MQVKGSFLELPLEGHTYMAVAFHVYTRAASMSIWVLRAASTLKFSDKKEHIVRKRALEISLNIPASKKPQHSGLLRSTNSHTLKRLTWSALELACWVEFQVSVTVSKWFYNQTMQ